VGQGLNVKAECRRIKRLSSSGEHKASVDSLAALKRKDGSCPDSTSRAVKASRSRLEAADTFVRLAMKQKRDGDLLAARGSLKEALVAYPRYYWVQKLLRGVEKSIIAENNARAEAAERRSRLKADIDKATEELNAARKAEKDGRLDDSTYHISQALIIIPPNDPLQGEIVEYARLIGMKSFSSGHLRQAREVWRLAVAADPDNEKLRKYLREVEYRIDNLEKIQKSGGSVGN